MAREYKANDTNIKGNERDREIYNDKERERERLKGMTRKKKEHNNMEWCGRCTRCARSAARCAGCPGLQAERCETTKESRNGEINENRKEQTRKR